MLRSLVGSEMCIRDSRGTDPNGYHHGNPTTEDTYRSDISSYTRYAANGRQTPLPGPNTTKRRPGRGVDTLAEPETDKKAETETLPKPTQFRETEERKGFNGSTVERKRRSHKTERETAVVKRRETGNRKQSQQDRSETQNRKTKQETERGPTVAKPTESQQDRS